MEGAGWAGGPYCGFLGDIQPAGTFHRINDSAEFAVLVRNIRCWSTNEGGRESETVGSCSWGGRNEDVVGDFL